MTDFDRIIRTELDRWADAGKIADFWLRDDDAIEPTNPLDRFLDLTSAFGVEATLAVIPARTGAALAHRLDDARPCCVAVHGWSHANHAGAKEKRQELGSHRPVADVLAELGEGFRHLASLHPTRFLPVLVPPWNRIDAALIPSLPALGFKGLSVSGPEKSCDIHCVNTQVDVMDWHGTGGGRDALVLAREVVARLKHMFVHGGTMGLLTHHLVHDEAVWDFMRRLFSVTVDHPAARWTQARAVFPL